jgi:hypothetical protein
MYLIREFQRWRNKLSVLVFTGAALSSPIAGATKSSDVVTCTVAASTDTLEFHRRFLQDPEYARFGLILCKPRRVAPGDMFLELSNHGSLTVRLFAIPASSAAQGEPKAYPAGLAKNLGLPERKNWVDLLDDLRKQQKLTAVLEGRIPVGGQLWAGYVATMESAGPVRAEADIMYSADALETEKLMTVPLERQVRRWDKVFDTLLAFGTSLLSVIAGAVLSYVFFRRQQRVIAELDELKLFRQRKLEKAAELLVFFRDVYNADLRTASDDVRKVRNLRRALVESRVYSMLPLDVMDELNRICDSEGPFPATRGKMLDDLLRTNFRELMVDS